jgi:hypothetical protein
MSRIRHQPPSVHRRSEVLSLAALSVVMLVVAGCSAQMKDPSSPYFPTSRPATSEVPLFAAALAVGGPRTTIIGAVSRPNPALTPGAVAITNPATVCALPAPSSSVVPYLETAAVLAAYKIPSQDAGQYGLDYLVPLDLGGSTSQANLWPASTKGIGYHEKETLNVRLHTLVCQGQLPLGQVQQELIADWYSLWLRYGS